MKILDHGTNPYDKQTSDLIAKTVPGMAHFAGTGPRNRTCRECRAFRAFGYYSKTGLHRGDLKPGECEKWKFLMRETRGIKISGRLEACKYFDENPEPAKERVGFQL